MLTVKDVDEAKAAAWGILLALQDATAGRYKPQQAEDSALFKLGEREELSDLGQAFFYFRAAAEGARASLLAVTLAEAMEPPVGWWTDLRNTLADTVSPT